MAKRTPAHLRSHLSVFEAERYPIQKGYIARLLILDGHSIADVAKEVKAIVQANEPHKELHVGSLKTNLYVFKKEVLNKKKHLTEYWPSLIGLFLEPFRVTFKSLTVVPASSQSVHPSVPSPSRHPEPSTSPTSVPSSSRHPEPSTSPTSEMLLEPDIPVTPTLMQPVQNSTTINSSSCLMTGQLPSPRKLKNDCSNCINKQRTIMNMLQKNKCLHQQSREFKMLYKVEKGNFSLKKFNEKIKRKTQSVNKWKMRYTSLSEACRGVHKLLQLVDSLEQQVKTLEEKLIAAQEENRNVASVNERLESLLEKTENDNAHLTRVHEQIKSLLVKTEDDDVHMKQVYEQFKSILEKTRDDVADSNRYRQASHSPEVGIKEESPWQAADNCGGNFALQNEEIKQEQIYEEHPERSRWKETISDDNTAVSMDVTSNISMKDILCGERCQVKTEHGCLDHGPSIYIDNAEVPCEQISNEDVIQTITAEGKVEHPNLYSENEADKVYKLTTGKIDVKRGRALWTALSGQLVIPCTSWIKSRQSEQRLGMLHCTTYSTNFQIEAKKTKIYLNFKQVVSRAEDFTSGELNASGLRMSNVELDLRQEQYEE